MAEEEFECSMCGRDGGPTVACDICHGNLHYRQSKAYTLSDLRSGRAKDERGSRVKPKTDGPGWVGHDPNG
jgi:hypothetical protein